MDAWNSKIDTFGRVVSGSGNIYLRQSYKDSDGQHLGTGWTPAFLSDDSIIWNNGNNVSQYGINSCETVTRNEQYDVIVAAKGKYVGRLVGIVTFENTNYDGDSISISKDGSNVGWITPYQSEWRKPVFNAGVTGYEAIISEISVGKAVAVWSEDDHRKTKGINFSDGVVKDYTVFTWEVSQVCDTPYGPFIVSYTQNGLAVRPISSKFGWYFKGVFYDPDSVWFNNLLVVVATGENGSAEYKEINVNSTSIDLTQTIDGINYHPPDPIPPDPIPIPPDPIPIPIPPVPKPEFKTARKYRMTDTKKVGLIMVDGKYVAFNPELSFNNITPDEFEMSQPDNLFQFKHVKTGKILGADATQYSQDICKQLYLIDHRQGYESWNVEHPSDSPDLIAAFVTYRRPEGINFSVKLRVVEL